MWINPQNCIFTSQSTWFRSTLHMIKKCNLAPIEHYTIKWAEHYRDDARMRIVRQCIRECSPLSSAYSQACCSLAVWLWSMLMGRFAAYNDCSARQTQKNNEGVDVWVCLLLRLYMWRAIHKYVKNTRNDLTINFSPPSADVSVQFILVLFVHVWISTRFWIYDWKYKRAIIIKISRNIIFGQIRVLTFGFEISARIVFLLSAMVTY